MARRHEALIPLSHDHREALALAFRLHNPAPPGPVTPTTPASTPESRRAETVAFFLGKLEPHFAIEEEVLFPVLRAELGASDDRCALVERLVVEHAQMRSACLALERAEDLAALELALKEFADILEAHVRCEERQLFAEFPRGLTEAAVDGLRREIHRRRPPDGSR